MRTLRTVLRHPIASWRIWRDVYRANLHPTTKEPDHDS